MRTNPPKEPRISVVMREPQRKKFLTVRQVTELHPGISERTLRHWIFGAKERRSWERGEVRTIPGNGFDQVMIRKGKKILIDEIALLDWLDGSQ
jgi:hypothetical protein